MNTENIIVPLLLKEYDAEMALTRKMLRIIPEGSWDFKPHEKSMALQPLAVHIAELASWPAMLLHTDGIDFAAMDYTPTPVANREALVELFEKSASEGRSNIAAAKDSDLDPMWTMRYGDKVLNSSTRYETLRHVFAQIIHHRAQLGVYLRLMNVPLPGTYGPSADEAML